MLRRRLGERRVGHAGTLDPGATGVLVVGVGNVTRLLRFVTDGRKRTRARWCSASRLDARRRRRGDGDARHGGRRRSTTSARRRRRAPHRRHRAGAADGVGAEGRRSTPARARPRGHRGRARARARSRRTASTSRRRPDAAACCDRRRRARRAPTSARSPPTSGACSAAAPTCATCGARRWCRSASTRRRRRTRPSCWHRSRRSAPCPRWSSAPTTRRASPSVRCWPDRTGRAVGDGHGRRRAARGVRGARIGPGQAGGGPRDQRRLKLDRASEAAPTSERPTTACLAGNAMMVRRWPSTSPSPPSTRRSATGSAPSSTTSSSRRSSRSAPSDEMEGDARGAYIARPLQAARQGQARGPVAAAHAQGVGRHGARPRRAGHGAGRGGQDPARAVGAQLPGARRGQHAHAAALGRPTSRRRSTSSRCARASRCRASR